MGCRSITMYFLSVLGFGFFISRELRGFNCDAFSVCSCLLRREWASVQCYITREKEKREAPGTGFKSKQRRPPPETNTTTKRKRTLRNEQANDANRRGGWSITLHEATNTLMSSTVYQSFIVNTNFFFSSSICLQDATCEKRNPTLVYFLRSKRGQEKEAAFLPHLDGYNSDYTFQPVIKAKRTVK